MIHVFGVSFFEYKKKLAWNLITTESIIKECGLISGVNCKWKDVIRRRHEFHKKKNINIQRGTSVLYVLKKNSALFQYIATNYLNHNIYLQHSSSFPAILPLVMSSSLWYISVPYAHPLGLVRPRISGTPTFPWTTKHETAMKTTFKLLFSFTQRVVVLPYTHTHTLQREQFLGTRKRKWQKRTYIYTLVLLKGECPLC